jgi:regulator of replication initiation timing
MDNIINKMKYELGDLKYQLMVAKEESKRVSDEVPEGFVRKDVYELMFDKATRQDNTIENLLNENSKLKKKFDNAVSELFENSKLKTNANSKMVFKLENRVSELLSENKEMKERLEKQEKTIKRLYNDTKINGCRYAFSNIPNDEEGNKFVEQMKLYFNYDSYDFRKRGQYLDNDKLSIGETWKTYSDGQPLSKSRCIRIYIDKKKGCK